MATTKGWVRKEDPKMELMPACSPLEQRVRDEEDVKMVVTRIRGG